MPGGLHGPDETGAGEKPRCGRRQRRPAAADTAPRLVPGGKGGGGMKRCVVHFNGADGFANFPAERLARLPENPAMIAALDGAGEIVGIFDLACVLSIHLSEQKDGGK